MKTGSGLVVLWIGAVLCLVVASRTDSSAEPGKGAAPAKSTPKSTDSCVDCHRNPNFIVTHPKLHQYFRDWERSVHRLSEVTCSDCHGGNPDVIDKDGAHGGDLGETSIDSAVNFANVPATCGDCHDEVHEAYVKSSHFEHLVEAREEKQGPSCVTCHGAMNTHTLNVNTVEEVCATCHNEKTGNHPEIPDKARDALNKMLSMDRIYRYIGRRMEPTTAAPFLRDMDDRMHRVAVEWHSFDLDAVAEQSAAVLKILKEKRVELGRGKDANGKSKGSRATP